MKSFKQFVVESSFPRIMNMLRGDVPSVDTVAILTAENPMGQKASNKENNARMRRLKQMLKSGFLHSIPLQGGEVNIKGKYGSVENSVLVPHISRERAIQMAAHFEQETVIWGEKEQAPNGESFIRFEWIEANTPQGEKPQVEDYETLQTRDVVISGQGVQDEEDMYSFFKGRKWVIPFFGPDAAYAPGKRRVQYPEDPTAEPEPEPIQVPRYRRPAVGESVINYVAKELPDKPEIRELIEEVKELERQLYLENRTEKYRWVRRALINEALVKIQKQLD